MAFTMPPSTLIACPVMKFSLLGQAPGGGATDTARRAGYQDYPALETEFHNDHLL
jgi:hypothetical protein